MAATFNVAVSKSREATGAGSVEGGAEEAWVGIDGEIGGRPR